MKRTQISSLFDELSHDSKTSFIKERSNRDELLREVVHSLMNWLNDIWSVVYEHNVNYIVAHTCLMFVADALSQLTENASIGGCKCAIMNLPVEFTLKDKTGKTLRKFSFLGPQNIDRILLWIWRDLFVSLFAQGAEKDKKRVSDLLGDIEAIMGISALERLVYGGRPSEFEDEEEFGYVYSADDDTCSSHDSSCSDADCDHYNGDCIFRAKYWSEEMSEKRIPLRECVEKRLIGIFKVKPSIRIYNTLMSISHDPGSTQDLVNSILWDIAEDTPDNLVAALEIYIANGKPALIATLIQKYSYLLRPRDAPTLQCAVSTLAYSSYCQLALSIVEQEIWNCLRGICASVRSCFSLIDEEKNKKELLDILKSRSHAERRDRIIIWIDQVSASPGNAPVHPMAFAAMMMGLPILPGTEDGDDADMLNYIDSDQHDRDLDDLREEYRLNLREMFDGWVRLAQHTKGGPSILSGLYVRACEIMPWIGGADVVNEMINKLQEHPNKLHVVDALTNLTTFAKLQRKRLSLLRTEREKKKNTPPAALLGSSSSAAVNQVGTHAISSSSPNSIEQNSVDGNSILLPAPGGMEEVD